MARTKQRKREGFRNQAEQSEPDKAKRPSDDLGKRTNSPIAAHDVQTTAMTRTKETEGNFSKKHAKQSAPGKAKRPSDNVGELTDAAIAAHDAKTLEKLASTPGLGLKEDPLFAADDGDEDVERGDVLDDDADADEFEDYCEFDSDEIGAYEEDECINESNQMHELKVEEKDVKARKDESAMEICKETDLVNPVMQEIKGEHATSGLGGGTDIVDFSGAGDSEVDESKRRHWRARKRMKEVAGLYWNWGRSSDNVIAEQKETLKRVRENQTLQRMCKLCGVHNPSAWSIDNHLASRKHDKMYSKHLLEMVLPLRRPDVLERRKQNEMERKAAAERAELKRLMRGNPDVAQKRKLDAEKKTPAKKQKLEAEKANPAQKRMVVKRCEVCRRDFINMQGYEGHLKGKKHIAAVARAEKAMKDRVHLAEVTSASTITGNGGSAAETAGRTKQMDGNLGMKTADNLPIATKTKSGNKGSATLSAAKASTGTDGLMAVTVAKSKTGSAAANMSRASASSSGTAEPTVSKPSMSHGGSAVADISKPRSSVDDLTVVKASTCNDDFVE